MNTLSIPEIFANLNFYKDNYLSLISNPADYYTPVASAYINIWPVGHVDLYLGDLLQLWFSEKWLINGPCFQLSEHPDHATRTPLQRSQDLYLYQLAGSALSGSNRCRVWSASEQKKLRVSLDSAFKYYCIYKGTDRPDISRSQLIQALKKAI
ncbi:MULTISPECIES: hypothetical protein [Acinetobacter]|uniref:hypothetical protein n=1 Tax=Acinetobacter TaxID=469 RepID=UPI0015D124A3|nr:hypothetical protein [Acinetobacter sp. YH12134]